MNVLNSFGKTTYTLGIVKNMKIFKAKELLWLLVSSCLLFSTSGYAGPVFTVISIDKVVGAKECPLGVVTGCALVSYRVDPNGTYSSPQPKEVSGAGLAAYTKHLNGTQGNSGPVRAVWAEPYHSATSWSEIAQLVLKNGASESGQAWAALPGDFDLPGVEVCVAAAWRQMPGLLMPMIPLSGTACVPIPPVPTNCSFDAPTIMLDHGNLPMASVNGHSQEGNLIITCNNASEIRILGNTNIPLVGQDNGELNSELTIDGKKMPDDGNGIPINVNAGSNAIVINNTIMSQPQSPGKYEGSTVIVIYMM